MRFHATFILGLVAYAAALPTIPQTGEIIEARDPQNRASPPPGTPTNDTQGVRLRDGEVCKTTSTEGVLACHDPSGASFNIVNGQRRNLKKRDEAEPEPEIEAVTEPGEESDDGFVAREVAEAQENDDGYDDDA